MDSIPTPPSPPSGPMTRARAKALHDKVNSLLSTIDLGSTLDGLLLHTDTLCILRYEPREQPRHPSTNAQGEAAEKNEVWTSRAGVSAVHPPESPPRPESPPSADRSLRPSPSDQRRTECDKFLTPDRILSGNRPESLPGPDTPVSAGRTLRPK